MMMVVIWEVSACLGMGRAICQSLLSAGAVIYALDKCQETLDSLVAEVCYIYFILFVKLCHCRCCLCLTCSVVNDCSNCLDVDDQSYIQCRPIRNTHVLGGDQLSLGASVLGQFVYFVFLVYFLIFLLLF